jgi:glycosyltransferase involved in cell wall biosynthesis
MTILVFSPRSINCSRAGGAEIYLHEILSRIKEVRFLVISSSDNESVADRLNRSYSEKVVSRHEVLFPIFSLRFARLIKSSDVVVENISKFPILWPPLLSKLLSKPFVAIVHHVHGKTLFRELPPLIALMLFLYEKLSLTLYSLLGALTIAVSKSTKKELLRLGYPDRRVFVVPPGLNIKESRPHDALKASKPLVVYIGRVKKYKRVDHLIKAMAMVARKVPHVKCVIAGKGDHDVYEKLRGLVKKLGLEEVVTLKRGLCEEEKIDLMKRAWVYVIPSMKEGFGISALEAQSCGTPVIAYEVPGLVDCVRSGTTGLLVPDGDYKALAEAISLLILNEELRVKKSRNAVLWASNFDWNLSAKKFLALLLKDLAT